MISPGQSRAARAFLNWSQEQLANAAEISRSTIADFERESSIPSDANLRALEEALTVNGIELVPETGKKGEGVRRTEVKVLIAGDPTIFAGGDAHLQLLYRGDKYLCIVSREALEDYGAPGGHIHGEGQSVAAVKRLASRIRAIAAKKIENDEAGPGRQVRLRSRDFS